MGRFLRLFAFGFCQVALVALPTYAEAPADIALKFTLSGTTLNYDTTVNDFEGIIAEDVDELLGILRRNPEIETLQINSGGGGYYAALDMARIVADFELNTHIDGKCASSCFFLFVGGETRTMSRGSHMGFHQTEWSADAIEGFYEDSKADYGWTNEFELASWIYEDTQEEIFLLLSFLIERGVDPIFAIETIRHQRDGLWKPSRARLRDAGVLTE